MHEHNTNKKKQYFTNYLCGLKFIVHEIISIMQMHAYIFSIILNRRNAFAFHNAFKHAIKSFFIIQKKIFKNYFIYFFIFMFPSVFCVIYTIFTCFEYVMYKFMQAIKALCLTMTITEMRKNRQLEGLAHLVI